MTEISGLRERDGGIYLVVADGSEEFTIALRYAASLAAANRAHIAILTFMEKESFQHWGDIEKRMREEIRDQAERLVWDAAGALRQMGAAMADAYAVFYVEEGDRFETLVDVVNRDLRIKAVILAGGTQSSGPGPLVSYFTGKGLVRLRVPLIVVPDNMDVPAL